MSRAKRFLSAIEYPEIAEFPDNPNPGRIVFIEGILWVFADLNGFGTWFPINRPQSSYVHSQGVASTVWNIYHGMGTSQVMVAVYDNTNNIIDAQIQHLQDEGDEWFTRVTMVTAESGYAVAFGTENLSAAVVTASTLEVSQSIRIGGLDVITDADVVTAFNNIKAEFDAYHIA
jgi:hypothetical protein